MLIISIKGIQCVYITSDVLPFIEQLIQSQVLIPIKSFSQYLNSGTKLAENVENASLITKYYGSDIAKTLTSIQSLEVYSDYQSLMTKITSILAKLADCTITANFEKKVYLYDLNKDVILYTYHAQLDDYQIKIGKNEYASYVGNIVFIQSTSELNNIGSDPSLNSRLSSSRNTRT